MNRLLTIFIVSMLLVGCGAAKKARVRQSKINTVIKTARSYTGVPYKWGGTTRSGMDCSGLLLNAYKAIGMTIPRTSADQSDYGKKVGKKDLKPGDWVFFATGKKKRKITHVGMVTIVKGSTIKFIHASSSLGVVEATLTSNYYQKIYRGARRPF
jgi:cell wall-associated NlpC family hydrolase